MACLWWGPRVLLAVFLNAAPERAALGPGLAPRALLRPAETLSIGVGWLLLRPPRFDVALPDFASLLRFMLLGVLVPVTLVAIGVQGSLLLTGVIAPRPGAPPAC